MNNIFQENNKSREYDLIDYILFLRSKLIRIIIFTFIISALSFIYYFQKEKSYISTLTFTSEDFISDYNNLSSEKVLEEQNITYTWLTNTFLKELNSINESMNDNSLFNFVSNEEKNLIQNSFQIVKIEDKNEAQKFKISFESISTKDNIKKIFSNIMTAATKNTKERLLSKIENSISDLNAQKINFDEFSNYIIEQSLREIESNIKRLTENLEGEIIVRKRIIEENLKIANKLEILEPRMDLLQPFLFVQSNEVNLEAGPRDSDVADDLFMSYVHEDVPLYFLGENILALELDRVNSQVHSDQGLNSTKLTKLRSLKTYPDTQLSKNETQTLKTILITKFDLDRIFIRLQNTLVNEEVEIASYQSNAITHKTTGIQIMNLQIIVIFLSLMFAALFYYISFINLIRNK